MFVTAVRYIARCESRPASDNTPLAADAQTAFSGFANGDTLSDIRLDR